MAGFQLINLTSLLVSSLQPPPTGSVASKLMAKMGYKPGQGLGKSSTGIKEPIKAVMKKSKAGIGLDDNEGNENFVSIVSYFTS